jgi:alpha-tubulin suppressor-like RCC1 family protein
MKATSLLSKITTALLFFCLISSTSNVAAQLDVAAGDWHAIYLLEGKVWATGGNDMGQLGDNTLIPVGTPQPVLNATGTAPLVDIREISAGNNHNLAVANDGTVWAWGDNSAGQLGNGTTTISSLPVQVIGVTNPVQVIAFEEYSVAVLPNGTMMHWGKGDSIPVLMPGLTDVTRAAIGTGSCSYHGPQYPEYTYTVIKTDSTVWSWGCNRWGQVGNNTWGLNGCCDPFFEASPVQVVGPGGVGFLTDIVEVAGGEEFTLALKSDGSVWAWGINFGNFIMVGGMRELFNCGQACPNNIEYPIQITKAPGEYFTDVVDIDAGTFTGMLVQSNGTVSTWGHNLAYGLGSGNNTSDTIIQPVSILTAPGTIPKVDVSNFNISYNLSIVAIDSCTIGSWGAAYVGSLGDGTAPFTFPLAQFNPVGAILCTTTSTHSDHPENTARLFAYPNPIHAGENLTIQVPEDLGEMTLIITDLVGKVVQKQQYIDDGDGILELNIGHEIQSGTYLLTTQNKHVKFNLKFVVQ